MMWVVVLAVGAGSFLFRLGPLLALRKVTLSEQADRAVRHAGLAAIAALIALSSRQAAQSASLLPVLLAVGVAAVLAARRASMLRLIVAGGGLYAGAVLAMGLLVN